METQLSDVYKVIGQRNRVAFLSPATYGSCSTRPLIPCLLYHASVVVQVIKKLDKNSKYFSYMNLQDKNCKQHFSKVWMWPVTKNVTLPSDYASVSGPSRWPHSGESSWGGSPWQAQPLATGRQLTSQLCCDQGLLLILMQFGRLHKKEEIVRGSNAVLSCHRSLLQSAGWASWRRPYQGF